MEDNRILKLEKSIENLKDKKCRIYLFVQDTKGNPKANKLKIYLVLKLYFVRLMTI